MEPAAPNVERATVLVDTVKRARSSGRYAGSARSCLKTPAGCRPRPTAASSASCFDPARRSVPISVILELSNPQVEQEALNARLALQSAEAALENLRVQLQNEFLTQQSQTAALDAEFQQARMQAEADEALAKEQLISEITRKQSNLKAETLKKRLAIEMQRFASANQSIDARTRVQQAAVDQARAMSTLQESRIAALKVTPGFSGVLQQVPVEVGQRVGPGRNLARVADPGRLKAELQDRGNPGQGHRGRPVG